MKPLDTKKEEVHSIDSHLSILSRADYRQLVKAGGSKNTVCAPAPEADREERFADGTADAAHIYIVDDEPRLTELYSIVLESEGYIAKPFNDRVEALAALKGETLKPDLLIMDYLGHPMPTERFMERCRVVHPMLRILLASGFNALDRRLASVKPDGFIQKPFTASAFLREVRATLVDR